MNKPNRKCFTKKILMFKSNGNWFKKKILMFKSNGNWFKKKILMLKSNCISKALLQLEVGELMVATKYKSTSSTILDTK